MNTLLSKVEVNHEYDVVEIEQLTTTIVADLENTFGKQGKRWFINNSKIYFRDSKDYFWFEMKF